MMYQNEYAHVLKLYIPTEKSVNFWIFIHSSMNTGKYTNAFNIYQNILGCAFYDFSTSECRSLYSMHEK